MFLDEKAHQVCFILNLSHWQRIWSCNLPITSSLFFVIQGEGGAGLDWLEKTKSRTQTAHVEIAQHVGILMHGKMKLPCYINKAGGQHQSHKRTKTVQEWQGNYWAGCWCNEKMPYVCKKSMCHVIVNYIKLTIPNYIKRVSWNNLKININQWEKQ